MLEVKDWMEYGTQNSYLPLDCNNLSYKYNIKKELYNGTDKFERKPNSHNR